MLASETAHVSHLLSVPFADADVFDLHVCAPMGSVAGVHRFRFKNRVNRDVESLVRKGS